MKGTGAVRRMGAAPSVILICAAGAGYGPFGLVGGGVGFAMAESALDVDEVVIERDQHAGANVSLSKAWRVNRAAAVWLF